jgi:hypothetical protein
MLVRTQRHKVNDYPEPKEKEKKKKRGKKEQAFIRLIRTTKKKII